MNDEGTCTYIILTESPWIKSGGDMNNAYGSPTAKTKIIKIIKLLISLLFKERILFGKKFLIIIEKYLII